MSGDGAGGDCTPYTSCSSPEQRSESRGSSVSAGLREEYEDLLKYAVVAPKLLDGSTTLPPTLPPTTESEARIYVLCMYGIMSDIRLHRVRRWGRGLRTGAGTHLRMRSTTLT